MEPALSQETHERIQKHIYNTVKSPFGFYDLFILMLSLCTLPAPLEELGGTLEMQYFILFGCGVALLTVRRLAVR
jgi:hypothetical protein